MKVTLNIPEKKKEQSPGPLKTLWYKIYGLIPENFKKHVETFCQGLSNKFIPVLAIIATAPIVIIFVLVFLHFQFGIDLPLLDIKNASTAQHWGQLGDFVGGMLNPLLSFMAFVAVLINLVLQRKDLALARLEAAEANKNQRMQSRIFEKQNEAVERQNFESTFFRLLDRHAQLSSSGSVKMPNTSKIFEGAACFNWIRNNFLPFSTYNEKVDTFFKANVENYADNYSVGLAQYFGNLYQILKFIDGYGHNSGLRDGALVGMRIRKAAKQYDTQRMYASILRAQLSNDELCCIFINCLSRKGDGLKYYIEKYSILKNVELPQPYRAEDITSLYQDIAYADSEDISREQIFDIIYQKYGKDTSRT